MDAGLVDESPVATPSPRELGPASALELVRSTDLNGFEGTRTSAPGIADVLRLGLKPN